jgi:hypothetical protein
VINKEIDRPEIVTREMVAEFFFWRAEGRKNHNSLMQLMFSKFRQRKVFGVSGIAVLVSFYRVHWGKLPFGNF